MSIQLSDWSLQSFILAIQMAKDTTGISLGLRAQDVLQQWLIDQINALPSQATLEEDICVITGKPKL